MRKLVFTCLIFGALFNVSAQTDDKKPLDIQFFPLVGFNGALNNIKHGAFPDELIEFKETEFYVEYVSLTAFLLHDWGISFRLQHLARNTEEDFRYSFSNSLVERFDERFFLPDTYSPDYIEANAGVYSNLNTKVYLGITRRLIYNKLELYPSLFLGYSQIKLQDYSATLKERNTNHIVNYSISNNVSDNQKENIELAVSMRVGYRLNNFLLAQCNLQYAYSKFDIIYTEGQTDLYTKQKSIHSFNYPKALHAYSLGLGIIFEINKL